jgi:hypothetical protein
LAEGGRGPIGAKDKKSWAAKQAGLWQAIERTNRFKREDQRTFAGASRELEFGALVRRFVGGTRSRPVIATTRSRERRSVAAIAICAETL